jgi:hypothetical protein
MILLSRMLKDTESRVMSAWREVKEVIYATLSVRCTQKEREPMSDVMDRLEAFRKEGSEKFDALSAEGNAIRSFADAKRENSADDYNLERIDAAAVHTVEASVAQSVEVYKMFAHSEKKL